MTDSPEQKIDSKFVAKKEKTCAQCEKPFLPTGNCQKRCADCKISYSNGKAKEKIPAVVPAKASSKTDHVLAAVSIIKKDQVGNVCKTLDDAASKIMNFVGYKSITLTGENYQITIARLDSTEQKK